MLIDNCFDVATYKRMAAGQLPAAEMERLCEHLEKCDRCLRVVRSFPEETIIASMRGKLKSLANAVDPAFVHALAQKILKQGENRSPESPGAIIVSCPGCANNLKVKKELVGQKVKCPKCGQVMQIPAVPVAFPKVNRSANVMDAPTLPPANARTIAPVQKDVTNPGNKPEATQGVDAKDDRSLIDFLAPAQQPDEIGRLGLYRVLKVLGAGGMGVVFKAEDPGLKRLVAIKAMLPAIAASASAKTRFLREAQAAAGIKHNHIVTIHQVSEDRGVPFLAMEFLEGESLDDRIKREPILPLPEVLRIGREMAEGIAAAHDRGLIHRDIKPANTWLEGKKAHVKILDFGLARPTDDQAHLTQSGAIIGTPAYMSPEQARGEKLDARCDLWSLGVVLYRICTGEVPFKGTDTVSTLMAVALNNPPPPKQVNAKVPAVLSDLVMKLLEKDPARRIGSAHAVVEALLGLEQGRQATQPNLDLSIKSVGRKLKSVGQELLSASRTIGRKAAAVSIAKAPGPIGNVTKRSKSRKPVLLALAGVLMTALILVAGIAMFRPAAEVSDPKGNNDPKNPSDGLANRFTNSVGIEFALVPKGKSWLGGANGQVGTNEVNIAQDFYLGVYEVTQEEWQKVTGKNPSHFTREHIGKEIGDDELKRFPVEDVTWAQAQAFVKLVNEKLKKEAAEAGWEYRLPTEQQWEYACRGGPMADKAESAFDYYFEKPEKTISSQQANFGQSGLGRPRKVGSYAPNRLGLFDMHGNVWEWCEDQYDPQASPGWVIRGGSWNDSAVSCRAASRPKSGPSYRWSNLGLRLARVPSEGNNDPKGSLDAMGNVAPPVVPSELKKVGENDLLVDFSYFEKLGLKVKDLILEYDRPGQMYVPKVEYKIYRMKLLIRFDKNLSADELKGVAAVFNTFPGRPGSTSGWGKSRYTVPDVPPAPDKVIYWFYDKDNISISKVYGRPSNVEGLISGTKGDVFRARFDTVAFWVGSPPTYLSVESAKTLIVRPIDNKMP